MKPKKYQAGGVAGNGEDAWIKVQKRTLSGQKHQAKSGGKMPRKSNKRGY